MEHLLKEFRIPLQICDTIRLKGINRSAFVQIINAKDGASERLRADLAKNTGLSQPQISAICDRISMDMKLSQLVSSSMPIKPSMGTSSSSTMMKIGTSGGGPSSKRISALLKQPASKPVQSSNNFSLLQNSSFVVKKTLNPQSKPIDTNSNQIGQKVEEESIVQPKIEPMKSPTEVRSIVMETTVADSGDSANPPSESEVTSAPAQFVAAGPVQEQASLISDLQKTIVEQTVEQIFEERSSSSDTEMEPCSDNNQNFDPEITAQYQAPLTEQTKTVPLEDDQLSLSSSEDEALLQYHRQQILLAEPLILTQKDDDEDGYSSSSSGTLSPLDCTGSRLNNTKDNFESDPKELNDIEQARPDVHQEQEDGPMQINKSPNYYGVDIPMVEAEEEEHDGFVIQGLDQKQVNQQEQQQIDDEYQLTQYEYPPEYFGDGQNLEEVKEVREQQQKIQDETDSECIEDQQILITSVQQLMDESTESKLLEQSKLETVDQGIQCEPWQPQVIVVEPEKKVMKNKKLQVTPERIEKSIKSPSKKQEEEKSSPIKQNGMKEQQSSSGTKSNENSLKMIVPSRTQIIPVVKQFSQSSFRESYIQVDEKEQQSSEITLSQLIEDTKISLRKIQQTSFSQKPPQVKSILKRFNHEREDDSFTQPDSKRVKWDPTVVEKLAEPGEESYVKRIIAEKKQLMRLAHQQRQQQQQQLAQAAQQSSSEDDDQNMFYDDEEEEGEEEDIEIQRPQGKQRRVMVVRGSRDDTDINQEESSSDEEQDETSRPISKGNSCHKIRNSWASEIKNWLNDINNKGKKPSFSQE